jgi:hypothetical protein
MRIRGFLMLVVGVGVLLAGPAAAAESCEVPPFRGALGPGGARATMTIVNDGGSCSITVYVEVSSRTMPEYLRAIVNPKSGTLRIRQPGVVSYRPSPGFVGTDEFSYGGGGRTPGGRLVDLSVTVSVTVLPPPEVAPTP